MTKSSSSESGNSNVSEVSQSEFSQEILNQVPLSKNSPPDSDKNYVYYDATPPGEVHNRQFTF